MYDPLALDRQRIELERLRRRTELAARRPSATDEGQHHEPTSHRLRVLRRAHRRPATAC